MQHQVLKQQVFPAVAGDLDQAVHRADRTGDEPDAVFLSFPLQHRKSIKMTIFKEGEGLVLADNDRGQQRQHLVPEIGFQVYRFDLF